jgi:hypothetical protein
MLFEGMSLDISYTYLDTELKELQTVTVPPGSLYDLLTPSAVADGPLALSPEHKLATTATYRLPLPETIGTVSPCTVSLYSSCTAASVPCRPDDVAKMIVSMLSDTTQSLHGAVVSVDGGVTAG